jgi:hypothetical protein
MSKTLSIKGPAYIERVPASQLTTTTAIESVSRRLAETFLSRLGTAGDFITAWNISSVDRYAQKHVEKWVESVGLHFRLYSYAKKTPSVNLPPSKSQRSVLPTGSRLKYKVFSGDVSGTIAEALFAFILRDHYGIAGENIIHLRASKTTGRTPDFSIRQVPILLEAIS